MKKLILAAFGLYRLITINSLHNCRFVPTCSQFAQEAIEKYGVVKGSILALKRIFTCHPFSKKPLYDPLPTGRQESA